MWATMWATKQSETLCGFFAAVLWGNTEMICVLCLLSMGRRGGEVQP